MKMPLHYIEIFIGKGSHIIMCFLILFLCVFLMNTVLIQSYTDTMNINTIIENLYIIHSGLGTRNYVSVCGTVCSPEIMHDVPYFRINGIEG